MRFVWNSDEKNKMMIKCIKCEYKINLNLKTEQMQNQIKNWIFF